MRNYTMHCLDVFEGFQSASNTDELWNKLHKEFSQFGITSMFYGFTHSIKQVEEFGIIESMWHKTDHPEEYRNYFDDMFYINDDLSAIHCMYKTNPFVWHDKQQWGYATKQQEEFMHESFEFDMGIGVSVPFRFNQHGVGGIGLCTAEIGDKEFDQIWSENNDKIVSICNMFDEITRSGRMSDIYSLSPREKEVLTLLASGKKTQDIIESTKRSASTIEKQIRSARKKLKARNNEQAVVKALILNLISP